MKLSLIYLISIVLLFQIFDSQSLNSVQKKASPKLNKDRFTGESHKLTSFYISSQTGDKSEISRKLKSSLKEFGLIHLLTPSGIHLSSLLLFIFLFIKKKFYKYIYFAFLLLIIPVSGFYSLKRILYFHIFKCFRLSTEAAFICTFIFDLLIGGFSNSPLSYAFSFLCWGVIIFSQKSKIQVIYNLFLAQLIICYFNQSEINILSIIINPIFTSLFSFVFPILSINFWFLPRSFFDTYCFKFFSVFEWLIVSLSSHTEALLFIPTAPLLLLCFYRKLNFKYIIITTVFCSMNLNRKSEKVLIANHPNIIIPLADSSEVISKNKRKINFWDRSCSIYAKGDFHRYLCKKKPSNLGGLSI